MLKNKLRIIAIIVALYTNSLAQNLSADLKAINAAYNSANNFSVQINVKMYESYTSGKVYYEESGIMCKKGSSSYQVFDNTEAIITPEYAIVVDPENKIISYNARKNTIKEDAFTSIISTDSLKLFCRKWNFILEKNELKSYEFEMRPEYPNYEKIKITFNPKTHLINRITYFSREEDISTHDEPEKLAKVRIEVDYSINTKPAYHSLEFSYEKYLIKNQKSFVLKPLYKDYELKVLNF